jgi:hypothetical protein
MKFNPFWFGVLRDPATGDPSGGGDPKPEDKPISLTLEQVNEIVNKAVANVKRELLKKDPPPPDPKPGKVDDPKPGDTPADQARKREFDEMKAVIESLKTENEKTKRHAEAKELDSLLSKELGKFEFAAPNANEDLFSILRPKVKRTEEGIFSEDGFSLEEYVKKSYDSRPHLHPAKPVGGSGATAGSRGKSSVDLNDIKPGMTKETRSAAWSDLGRVLGK